VERFEASKINYFSNKTNIILANAVMMTITPAIFMMIAGINGIVNVSKNIAKPTAKDTIIPVSQAKKFNK
jgi:hypothetical protein